MEQTHQPLTGKELTLVSDTIEELLRKLDVAATVSATEQDEILEVILETEDSGMLIGYHGEILESLQLVAALLIAKKIGRFVRVSIEIGDYKKNRIAYLERLAYETKERVLDEKREHTIASLKAWERRIVHMVLQEDDEVTSESIGEGRDRVLIVRPK
jgi:spoIIIJ-associated protein